MKSDTKLLVLISIVFFLYRTESAAQRNVPIGTLPTYYNGGFAGEAGALRASSFSYLKYKMQSVQGSDQLGAAGTLFSVDHFLTKLSTGIAITAGPENYSSISKGGFLSAAISPKISFKGKYTLAPFADFSYERFHTVLTYDLAQNFPSDFVTKDLQIRTGFLLNTSKAYIGLTADIANYTTDYPTFTEKWQVFSKVALTLQAGYTFQKTPDSKFSFTPQLALRFGGPLETYYMTLQPTETNVISLMDLNLMFRYNKFIAGFNNAGLAVGYQTSRFKFQFTNSYHWNDSREYFGSISLRYVFRKKEQSMMPGF